MEKQEKQSIQKQMFRKLLVKYALQIEHVRQLAHELHRSVNQTYGKGHPYGYHLDMVAKGVQDYGYLVCASEDDVLPLFFGAYYHDSIEDARLTYNDVMKVARDFMTDEQALMATEIVYALTNDKGRTRAERAGEHYYQGIRQTPYAPFVKLCDRLANITYSCQTKNANNSRMKQIYREELPHFLSSIDSHSTDVRFSVPAEVVAQLSACLTDDFEHE